MTSPLFEDNSSAGYDQDCHELTIDAARRWGLDPWDPADRRAIIQRLDAWLTKLRRATPPAPPWRPTADNPF